MMSLSPIPATLALLAALASGAAPAAARVLEAGPGKLYALPSAAIAQARAGDTVRIAPGTYADCATIAQDKLTVEGDGPGARLAGKACAGKAILVVSGKDVAIRNLTLSGARVPDRNGAGIRAEGGNLTIENVRFEDNENGLMTAAIPGARIAVLGSTFAGNGKCEPVCAHAIYAGRISALRVERSRFEATKDGHHIKSRAALTEILDTDIDDGPAGTASYLVELPNGGDLVLAGSRLRKGPRAANKTAIVSIGAEGASNATLSLRISGNTASNALAPGRVE